MIKIGDTLSNLSSLSKNSYTLNSSGQIIMSYNIFIDGIKYTICVDKNNTINYIETKDKKFETLEGIKLGMTFKSIKDARDKRLNKELGWAYVMPLKDGWNAAFEFSKSNIQEMSSDSTIVWFFKRK